MIVYKKAKELVLLIYNSIQENLGRKPEDELNADMSSSFRREPHSSERGGRHKITKEFPREELYVLLPQMRRAVISIMANIVEGYAKSRGEFARFIDISIGSATELEVYLELSFDLKYLNEDKFYKAYNLLLEVKKLLYTYKRSLRSS